MHARTTPRWSARSLASVLGLVAALACVSGPVSPATADSSMMANSTKRGNDGHPYYWAAPC